MFKAKSLQHFFNCSTPYAEQSVTAGWRSAKCAVSLIIKLKNGTTESSVCLPIYTLTVVVFSKCINGLTPDNGQSIIGIWEFLFTVIYGTSECVLQKGYNYHTINQIIIRVHSLTVTQNPYFLTELITSVSFCVWKKWISRRRYLF